VSFSRTPLGEHSEQADGLAHRGLDVQALDVLPVLLEEGDEEVDRCGNVRCVDRERKRRRTKHDVSEDGILSHLDVADGNTEAKHLDKSALAGKQCRITGEHTFFSWNLMVERTSVSLLERSSACEIGVGNFPATEGMSEGGE
jgi:hypothetical protein